MCHFQRVGHKTIGWKHNKNNKGESVSFWNTPQDIIKTKDAVYRPSINVIKRQRLFALSGISGRSHLRDMMCSII
jgi:hypothetical protein